jgi:hypothetical protein
VELPDEFQHRSVREMQGETGTLEGAKSRENVVMINITGIPELASDVGIEDATLYRSSPNASMLRTAGHSLGLRGREG